MTTIAVPRSLAETLRPASEPIRLVDEQGQVLGSFAPIAVTDSADDLTAEEIAEMKRRVNSPGPWYSTDEMINYVRSREARLMRYRVQLEDWFSGAIRSSRDYYGIVGRSGAERQAAEIAWLSNS